MSSYMVNQGGFPFTWLNHTGQWWYWPIIEHCTGKKTWFPMISPIHRIHVWYIDANIGGILMVNVTIYSIHGSYGYTYMPIPSSLREISRRQPCGLSENGWLMIMTFPMKNMAFFNEHTPISDTYIRKKIHPLKSSHLLLKLY
jgi:hypothetical protein